jgi:uncharacterized membrane protein YkgB
VTPDEARWVEWEHPGWRELVATDKFMDWLWEQPEWVRTLAETGKQAETKLVLDLYKMDSRSSVPTGARVVWH